MEQAEMGTRHQSQWSRLYKSISVRPHRFTMSEQQRAAEKMHIRNSFGRALRHLHSEKKFGRNILMRDAFLVRMRQSEKCTPEILEAISELPDDSKVDDAINFLTHHRLNFVDEATWAWWTKDMKEQEQRRLVSLKK
jgi:hypothetical protein